MDAPCPDWKTTCFDTMLEEPVLEAVLPYVATSLLTCDVFCDCSYSL